MRKYNNLALGAGIVSGGVGAYLFLRYIVLEVIEVIDLSIQKKAVKQWKQKKKQ